MSKYSELLKDPRWQKKRLDILQKDNWSCRRCFSKTETLHVHHLWYDKDKMPWDYPDEALVTYCHSCHDRVGTVNWRKALFDLNLTEYDLLEIASYLHWAKKKSDEMSVSGTRFNHLVSLVDVFRDEDDLNSFYNTGFSMDIKNKYIEQ